MFIFATGALWQRKCYNQPIRLAAGAPAHPLTLPPQELFHLISSSAKVERSRPPCCSQGTPTATPAQLFGPFWFCNSGVQETMLQENIGVQEKSNLREEAFN